MRRKHRLRWPAPIRVRRPRELPLDVWHDLDRVQRLGLMSVWSWPELSRRKLVTGEWCAVTDVPLKLDRTKAIFGEPSFLGHARLAFNGRRKAQEPA